MMELWPAIKGMLYFLTKCFKLPPEEICENCKKTHHTKLSSYLLCSCGHDKTKHREYGHCTEIIGTAIMKGVKIRYHI